MKYQILVDSSADFLESKFLNSNIRFKSIPLTICVGEREFVDNEELDTHEMLSCVHAYKGKTSSACPSPQSFLDEFDKAEFTFVVTITQKLSGSYNSAVVAKNSYSKPENVCVIDSKATSGTMILVVEELVRQIEGGKSFEEICKNIMTFRDSKTLFFVLQKFDNLVANGRMSHVAGFIANALFIRPICRAVDGEIKIALKLMGPKNAFQKLVKMTNEECKDKTAKIVISHCEDEQNALFVKNELEKCGFLNIQIVPTRGLTSYYALEKGMILCF